jgi:hypothetical protein
MPAETGKERNDEKAIYVQRVVLRFCACANVVCNRLLDKKWKLLSPGLPQQS